MTQARVTCSQARPSSEGLRASLFSPRVRVCPMPLLQQCWDRGRMGGQPPGHLRNQPQARPLGVWVTRVVILSPENSNLSCQAPQAPGFFSSFLCPPVFFPYFPFLPSFLPSSFWRAPEYASPKFATFGGWLFWAVGIWKTANPMRGCLWTVPSA